jgi:hypothetical protein
MSMDHNCLMNCKARPQCKRQVQLIRALVSHRFLQLFFLLWCQCSAAAFWAAAHFNGYRCFAISNVRIIPSANSRSINSCYIGYFLVFSSGFSKPDSLIPELLLGSVLSWRASIFSMHRSIAYYAYNVKYFVAGLIPRFFIDRRFLLILLRLSPFEKRIAFKKRRLMPIVFFLAVKAVICANLSMNYPAIFIIS